MLTALTRVVDWVWITGNHDEGLSGDIGGAMTVEAQVGGIILRHNARPSELNPEISGHFHPRLIVSARGRRVARPCAVRSEGRLILPSYGALTGGMDAAAPEIIAAMQPARAIDALAASGERLVEFPLWRCAT
jgi:metallophosphoesterase superfamily enzyme